MPVLALGLVVLTRPLYLAYLPAPCLLWLWHGRGRPGLALARCTFFVLSVALTVLPWTLRNYTVYDRLVPVSTGFGTSSGKATSGVAGRRRRSDLRWNTPDWHRRVAPLPTPNDRRWPADTSR